MAIDVKFDLKAGTGQPIDVMHDIIELRKKELGETTAQACIAMAIGILKSLRAATTTAKTKGDISVTHADGRYTPSWKREGRRARRVLRAGERGAEVTPSRVVWKTGKYVKGEVLHSYEVVDQVAPDKQYAYILVTDGGGAAAAKYA